MNSRQTLSLLARWSPLLVALTVIGAVVGYTTGGHPRTYAATSVIYVGTQSPGTDPAEVNNIVAFDQMMVTLAAMVPTATVAGRAVSAPGGERSVQTVVAETTATVVPSTNLIRVTVTDRSATVAADLANRVAAALVSYTQAAPGSTTGGAIVEPMRVFAQAGVPGAPVAGPSRSKRSAEGALLGLLLAVLAVLLIDSLRAPRPAPAEVPVAGGPDDI